MITLLGLTVLLTCATPEWTGGASRPRYGQGTGGVGHADAVDETSPGSRTAGQFIKVIFELSQDDDGWPPAGSEGLWAVPVTPDVVRLDNTPYFVRGVATSDLIRVRRKEDGQLQADERLQWSGHCTIRIIVFRDGPAERVAAAGP